MGETQMVKLVAKCLHSDVPGDYNFVYLCLLSSTLSSLVSFRTQWDRSEKALRFPAVYSALEAPAGGLFVARTGLEKCFPLAKVGN